MIMTALLTVAIAATTAQHHHGTLDERGKRVMGFDQEKTVHHFHLYTDGGAIDVRVTDPKDAANLQAIRAHLPHIAAMFSEGNFEAPMLVHATEVPGTKAMARLKERITFRYSETATGGRVDIITSDATALAAVHAFLRFQIEDHATGDTTEVKQRNEAK